MAGADRMRELNDIFSDLAEELDVPPSKYEEATSHYEAVGNWLNEEGTALARYRPTIFPQGSFALGTPVKPQGEEEYDVDAVCLMDLRKRDVSQQQLKAMVGNRLRENLTYAQMLEPKDGGRRCWTLQYADGSKFHLDILPAIPDEYQWLVAMGVPPELAKHAICITDKETWNTAADWPKSNPKGYLLWFKGRMQAAFEQRRMAMARETRAEVQNVPEYKVRTPLQRTVQLFKRHRDVKHNGDDDKPISIIITTLAAHAYNNEVGLFDALQAMLPKMRAGIQNRAGTLWVPNPVNPAENFADKWSETPRKREIFFGWLASLEDFNRRLLGARDMQAVGDMLVEGYGEKFGKQALERYASRTRSRTVVAAPSPRVPSRFDVPHREIPRWPIVPKYGVGIDGRASKQGFRNIDLNGGSRALPKHFSLRFEASTNAPAPFDVYWQVVNTGAEAAAVNGLRGSIFSDGLVRTEKTLYAGMHWIECFIVKDGKCVARSGEFVINIQ